MLLLILGFIFAMLCSAKAEVAGWHELSWAYSFVAAWFCYRMVRKI